MKKHELWKRDNELWRVLDVWEEKRLVIDCRKKNMPVWKEAVWFDGWEQADESELMAEMSSEYDEPLVWKRYTMIAGILPYLGDLAERSRQIRMAADMNECSTQTIRTYLCRYLVFQDVRMLATVKPKAEKELTEDQKNIRWALNKFYYSRYRNTLVTAYIKMLQERYTDDSGQLLDEYPSIYQFRYFFKKYNKMQNYYIARDGIKDYQRNHRPLLGDGVQEFAPAAGTAMNDGTVCDIYLVDEAGKVIGRPLLVASIDAYSGLCLGYFLGWEGGVYSLRGLVANILEDKVEHCRRHGIEIEPDQWPVQGVLPGTMITDRGSEYISETFSQLTERGTRIINVDGFRPELKGPVEKLFDLVQSEYEQHLHGFGTLEADYAERGAKEYRKEACLRLEEFEQIVIRCILYHNSQRIAEDFPYTEEMLDIGVKPHANALFEYGKTLPGAAMIPCSIQDAILTLLPRTTGEFGRQGLKVNGMRYKASGFTEEYLRGGSVTVSYNPDDSSKVWLQRSGNYVPFQLIEKRFQGKTVETVNRMQERQKEIVTAERKKRLQARVNLANQIDAITGRVSRTQETDLKEIRKTRQREREINHIDFWNERGLG